MFAFLEGDDRNSEAAAEVLAVCGTGDGSDLQAAIAHLLPQEPDPQSGGRSRTESDRHACGHEFKGPLGRFQFKTVYLRRVHSRSHALPPKQRIAFEVSNIPEHSLGQRGDCGDCSLCGPVDKNNPPSRVELIMVCLLKDTPAPPIRSLPHVFCSCTLARCAA